MFATLLAVGAIVNPVIPFDDRGSGRDAEKISQQCRRPGQVRPDLPKCTLTTLPEVLTKSATSQWMIQISRSVDSPWEDWQSVSGTVEDLNTAMNLIQIANPGWGVRSLEKQTKSQGDDPDMKGREDIPPNSTGSGTR